MKNTMLASCLTIALAFTLGGCEIKSRAPVTGAAAVPLAGTNWRLTQLGGEVVANTGDNPVNLQLLTQNPRAAGFAGCNRMFGGYALSGDSLKFDQMGATKMACMDSARMQLEQRYLEMFANVARWKISGNALQLLDATGAPVSTFEASGPAQ